MNIHKIDLKNVFSKEEIKQKLKEIEPIRKMILKLERRLDLLNEELEKAFKTKNIELQNQIYIDLDKCNYALNVLYDLKE